MKYFTLFLFLFACTPTTWKVATDILEGEATVIENVIEDVSGLPHQKPSVKTVSK
jgi:hypothetical protein